MSRKNGRSNYDYGGTTLPGFVDTADGLIPHRVLVTPHGNVHAPVCVVTSLRNSYGLPMAERDSDGRMIYALPGGGRFAA